jgi:hypothetical protein
MTGDYRSSPSLLSTVIAVWLAGAGTSFAGTLVVSALLFSRSDDGTLQVPSSTALLVACVASVVLGAALGAAIVYAVLAWDGSAGGGVSYARALAALLAGKLVGLLVLAWLAAAWLDETEAVGGEVPAESSGVVVGLLALPLSSLLLTPVSSLGFVVSVLIVMSGSSSSSRRSSGDTPWEYKLPPGASWRE